MNTTKYTIPADIMRFEPCKSGLASFALRNPSGSWTGDVRELLLGVNLALSLKYRCWATMKLSRETPGSFDGAYLSRADLSGADLSGADLSGAYLSGADLSRADLSGADLSGASLSGANLTDVIGLTEKAVTP